MLSTEAVVNLEVNTLSRRDRFPVADGAAILSRAVDYGRRDFIVEISWHVNASHLLGAAIQEDWTIERPLVALEAVVSVDINAVAERDRDRTRRVILHIVVIEIVCGVVGSLSRINTCKDSASGTRATTITKERGSSLRRGIILAEKEAAKLVADAPTYPGVPVVA